MSRFFVVLLLAGAFQAAAAEDKFYPIVGADGSVQVIHSPADGEAKGGKEKPRPALPKHKVATPVQEKDAVPAADPRSGAAYDSDEYADSEALERQSREDAQKKRFYIINDEQGPVVNEGGSVFVPEDVQSPFSQGDERREPYRVVDEGGREIGAEEAVSLLPGLAGCLAGDDGKEAAELAPGAHATLVVDRNVYGFLKKPGVAALYRIGGEGLRSMVVSSFSRTDRKPGFVHPYLAFYGNNGCLTRVTTNFFEAFYPATERRHPMLKANVAVHTEESYMLVLLPQGGPGQSSVSLPYGYSRFGQLKFTVKKQ